jgi:hypothetical protein
MLLELTVHYLALQFFIYIICIFWWKTECLYLCILYNRQQNTLHIVATIQHMSKEERGEDWVSTVRIVTPSESPFLCFVYTTENTTEWWLSVVVTSLNVSHFLFEELTVLIPEPSYSLLTSNCMHWLTSGTLLKHDPIFFYDLTCDPDDFCRWQW